jgi:hypothetical protein
MKNGSSAPHEAEVPLRAKAEALGERVARVEEHADVAEEARRRALVGGVRDAGPAGEATVHAGDAVVPRAEEALHGLEREQGEDPVLDAGTVDPVDLDVVVLGRDEHVQLGAGPGVRVLERVEVALGDRRLEERWPGEIANHEREGLGAGSVLLRRAEQQRAPRGLVVGQLGLAGARQRQRGELHQEGVHRVLLVRLHRSERGGFRMREPGE